MYTQLKPSTEDCLEHFGVPGMRWGVRRARSDRRETQKQFKNVDRKKISKGKVILTGTAILGASVATAYILKDTPLGKKVRNSVGSQIGKAFKIKGPDTMPDLLTPKRDWGPRGNTNIMKAALKQANVTHPLNAKDGIAPVRSALPLLKDLPDFEVEQIVRAMLIK